MKIVEETREEPEERLLEEIGILLVHIGQDKHEDGKNLREIGHLGMFIVDTRCISMVFDNVHDKSGHGIQSLIRMREVARVDGFAVACYTSFGANTEKEKRHVVRFEDALFRELIDERDEGLFRGRGALKDADPLLEPDEKLVTELCCVGFAQGSARCRTIDR